MMKSVIAFLKTTLVGVFFLSLPFVLIELACAWKLENALFWFSIATVTVIFCFGLGFLILENK